MRSFGDIEAWLSQPCTNTVETAAAPWWRMMPESSLVTIRRPVAEVIDSLMAVPGVTFDRALLEKRINELDRKLDQIEKRTGCLSVPFASLESEETCARIFEHCLPYKHDPAHWAKLANENVQINLAAYMRYYVANADALEKLCAVARQKAFSAFATVPPVEPDGMTFQTETFDQWVNDGSHLFDAHLIQVGEAPGDWQKKNLALMRVLYDAGAIQIMTARSNGRMFGYLMTLVSPSLVSDKLTSATNTTFYASPDYPGLGLKLQRAALCELKRRGVNEVFFEAGKRGSGPRLGTLYKRLGAVEHGTAYRLELQ